MKVGAEETGLQAGFAIRLLQKDEAGRMGELVRLFAEVFEEGDSAPIDEKHLSGLLQHPQFLALVVLDETNSVVGGLTAYILPRYRPGAAEAFIFDVAVHPLHQRKGLGLKLLQVFHSHCAGAGIQTVFVPAHEEDEHALDFYRRAGGAEERVRLFVFDTAAGARV